MHRSEQITEARLTSRRSGVSTLVLTEGEFREYFRFENGSLVIYDVTGKREGQVALNIEELQIIRETDPRRERRYATAN
jgi:hypothetical protein